MNYQSTYKQFFIVLGTILITRCFQFFKKTWMFFAFLLIFIAILFSLFRALTPWATQYKGEIEQHLSKMLGQPVVISSMETSWYWFEPVLKLDEVTLSDGKKHVLKLQKLLVGIDLLGSLWHWHIQPGILYVDNVNLTIHQMADHWEIDGLRRDQQKMTLDQEAYLPILTWFLVQKKIILKNISAMVHLKDGSLLPINALNITVMNHDGHYRVKGSAELMQTTPTEVSILADVKLNPDDPRNIGGHVYLSLRHFLLTQWRVFFPKTDYVLEGGKGDLELWLDLAKGQVTNLQSNVHFHHIAWSKHDLSKTQFIQSLKANLAFVPNRSGWKLSGDHVHLRLGGIRWPENSFQVAYNQPDQTYNLYIQHLLIAPTLSLDAPWPLAMQPLFALKPRGYLNDTQMNIAQGKMDYLLTRFSEMGFTGQGKMPTVKNISGILRWQPTAGHLAIDGESTVIKLPKKPALTFKQVNAGIEWKTEDSGLLINMDRFVLTQPDLTFTARGVLKDPGTPTSSLQLTALFSADNAKQWFRYLPSLEGKPKLHEWLNHGIQRIGHVNGQLNVNGPLADFPFDKKPGEFSVQSHFTGFDLYFNKEWPMTRDLDAYLTVNHRNLEANVLTGTLFEGVEAKNVHLRLDDLGLGKDTLLIHGNAISKGNQTVAYIVSSPLKKHLAKLKKLDLLGSLGLDLRLEIPLYPGNDKVLADGAITFDQNKINLDQLVNHVELTNVSGQLFFDESGIKDSFLKALFLDDPMTLHIQSIHRPKPSTTILIESKTTTEKLNNQFKLPIFSVIKGAFNYNGKLELTDDPNEFDHIQMGTLLQGVAVDLPAPFGKLEKSDAPLVIDLDVNGEKSLRMRLKYKALIATDLLFNASKSGFLLNGGEIHVGKGDASPTKEPGIKITAELPEFNYDEWYKQFSSVSDGAVSDDVLHHVQTVDVDFAKLIWRGQQYKEVALIADKINKDTWDFDIDQPDIEGEFTYQRSLNKISGRLSRLYLGKSSFSNGHDGASFKPTDIPNLDLSIDLLKWNEMELGSIEIKSTSKGNNWHIDDCKLTSPLYELSVAGDWKQKDGKNNTHLKGDLQITKLKDLLERLDIVPAVEAHLVDFKFDGAWPGSITEFSLPKTRADISLELKDGRITHLSPEVEEKMGIGKLLSILSLQTIPRRLKLDFSDLSGPGYSYDVFKGNFILKDGVMRTNDSYIDGPVAYATMKGGLDVIKHLYDVDLHISPHITASLPVVATIAGGPIAGAATWVASKIISQGMQTVTGYTYKITGPWQEPVVKQVNIFKKPPPADADIH